MTKQYDEYIAVWDSASDRTASAVWDTPLGAIQDLIEILGVDTEQASSMIVYKIEKDIPFVIQSKIEFI